MQHSTLAVFDSGIGGASIVKHLLINGPSKIIYLADAMHFPYGNRSQSWITSRISEITSWFSSFDPDCLLIACNSATVNTIDALRKTLSIPIVGIEPVIKPLAKYPSSLLLATQTTLNAQSTQDLLTQFAPANLISHASRNLATNIEEMQDEAIDATISSLASSRPHPPAIGLSCTHYPLITDSFQNYFPDSTIIDPSLAVVNQISTYCDFSSQPDIDWYTTGSVLRLKKQLQKYLDIDTQPKLAKI